VSLLQLWPTNVWVEHVDIDDSAHNALHDAIKPYIDKFNGTPEIFDSSITIPNIFENPDDSIQDFRGFIRDRMNTFLRIEGFINPEDLSMEAVCFARRFKTGDRARPHTHRSVDYVGVYYLDLDVVDDGEDTADHDDGRLLLIDPIAQRSRGLNHSMCFQLRPEPKLLVIHPAYVFHESEMYKGEKDRDLLVINIKVLDRQQSGVFKTL
jgi:hypothetical protein